LGLWFRAALSSAGLLLVGLGNEVSPAIAILAAILVARVQLRAARRATGITIAKTPFRKMLVLFFEITDILYRGTTHERFVELKKDTAAYLRYRMLSTNMTFVCQESFS
jgi:hypothetical protein